MFVPRERMEKKTKEIKECNLLNEGADTRCLEEIEGDISLAAQSDIVAENATPSAKVQLGNQRNCAIGRVSPREKKLD